MRRVVVTPCLFVTALFLVPIGLAEPTHATVVVTHDNGIPTVGLPGFRTVTVTATSTVLGEPIGGVDFYGGPIYSNDFGFFGPMNQIKLGPFSTVFLGDFDSIIGGNPQHDSHFLVRPIADQVSVPTGFFAEDSTTLRALFAKGDLFGQSMPLVQLVVPASAASTITYRGVFAVLRNGSFVTTPEIFGTIIIPIPEPGSSILVGIILATWSSFARRCRVRPFHSLSGQRTILRA